MNALRAWLPAVWIACVCAVSMAERLPLTSYTTSDGLGNDGVRRIVADSRGFLWICHRRGVSRFDGERFDSLGGKNGLPEADIIDVLETQHGVYLVASRRALFVFDPRSVDRPFTRVGLQRDSPLSVRAILEDDTGTSWLVDYDALFRIEINDQGANLVQTITGFRETGDEPILATRAAIAAGDGSLWIGVHGGVLRKPAEGSALRYGVDDGLPSGTVLSLLEDRAGDVWAGTTAGLARFDRKSGRWQSELIEEFAWIHALLQDGDGTIWIGSTIGLGAVRTDESGRRYLRWYTTVNGMNQNEVTALAEDRDGDLWIGTEASGLMRLARRGLTSWIESEGLEEPRVSTVFETNDGQLCVGGGRDLFCREGDRFERIKIGIEVQKRGWGWHQWFLQDHLGDWWIPTGEGLFRFTGIDRIEELAAAKPAAVFTARDGLPVDGIFRLFEDSRGDIWIGTMSAEQNYQLSRWERSSGRIHRYDQRHGLTIHAPTAFHEDRDGQLWIGFYAGGIVRYSRGRFDSFTPADGCPAGLVRDLHSDALGRLWVAADGGLSRVDQPTAEKPGFVSIGIEQGLSSRSITAITEDHLGRLYFGSDNGIDRLDMKTGRIRRYTSADGLPNAFVNSAFRDHRGDLWFGTLRGVGRLKPGQDPPQHAPEVRISAVSIAGKAHPVSRLGEIEVAEARLPAKWNRLKIEFGSIAFDPECKSLFQYRLEGTKESWSAPTESRSVDYANLAPGSYRFLVRALNVDGEISEQAASFRFTITPPFWRRPWFVMLLVSTVAAVAFTVHRQRVLRAIELERVRTRIATDLHDDIGSSLSRIAILSEQAQRKGRRDPAAMGAPLERIAGLSRELVDSMSDIVWAINPKRDRFSDIIFRMRRFAADAFTGSDIEFSFLAEPADEDLQLGADMRRELYLVFKECVNNAVRHSGCTRAEIRLSVSGGRLSLTIHDDGQGFDRETTHAGQGLVSMRSRIEGLGGVFRVETNTGSGTQTDIEVPLARSARSSYRNVWDKRTRGGVS